MDIDIFEIRSIEATPSKKLDNGEYVTRIYLREGINNESVITVYSKRPLKIEESNT